MPSNREIAEEVYSETWGACKGWPPKTCPEQGACVCQMDIDQFALALDAAEQRGFERAREMAALAAETKAPTFRLQKGSYAYQANACNAVAAAIRAISYAGEDEK